MDAYIDFENFCSYLKSMNHPDFKDCNDVLIENFNLNFTFDKSTLSKTKKEIRNNFNLWLKNATKRRNGHHNNWNVSFPPRPITVNSFNSFSTDQLSSLYLIDGENVNACANAGCLLIAPKGKELDVIKQLQTEKSFCPSKKFRIRDMFDWSSYGNNVTSFTDLIVVDPFIFAQSDLEYPNNAYALFEKLCNKIKGYPH